MFSERVLRMNKLFGRGRKNVPAEDILYYEDEQCPDEAVVYDGEYPEEGAEYPEEPGYEAQGGYSEDEPEYEDQEEYLEEEAEYAGEYEALEEYPEEEAEYLEEPGYEAQGGYPEEEAEYPEEPGYEAQGGYSEDEPEYEDQEEYLEEEAEYEILEEYPSDDPEYYEGQEYIADDIAYEDSEEEPYYEDVYGEYAEAGSRQSVSLFTKIFAAVSGMNVMDKVMVVVSVIVLILAIVTIMVFINSRMAGSHVAAFADVGSQLEGIDTIGGQGIAAVADAEIARISAATVTPEPTVEPEEPPKEYDEVDYKRQVAVEPDFTSIQKDLKIKFLNAKTGKLVPNVPFSVTVTDPDGKSYIWSDDDMDGIIYKKDIKSGSYKVTMESLTDTKYSSYTIASATKTVEVKEEIVYKKVDVENEVKQETEVNAAKEDTKIAETVVESALQDTLPWVESKVIGSAYNEVGKSAIADPLTLTLTKSFLGMSRMKSPGTDSASESVRSPGANSVTKSMQNPGTDPTNSP